MGELGDEVGVGGGGVLGDAGVELGLEGGGFVVELGEVLADVRAVGDSGWAGVVAELGKPASCAARFPRTAVPMHPPSLSRR